MDNVAVTKNTYKDIFEQYTKNNSQLSIEMQKALDKFINSLPSEKNILDVGCANGRESKYLFEHNCRVTGIDITEEFIEAAKSNCPFCNFQVTDMRNLPFKENTFDGIWASASFLHIPKKDSFQTLNSFNKVLKSRGILYLSVMEGDYDDLRPNETMKWGNRHFSDYTQKELENLIKSCKFKVIEKVVFTTHWGKTFLHYYCRK